MNPLTLLLQNKIAILDGATGTMLQKRGMPAGVSPEQYCLDHPEAIRGLQSEYLEAGTDILCSPTFGANRIKLKNYGLENKVREINLGLAGHSLAVARAAGRLVAGEIGPTGIFFRPFGETSFEEGFEIFREQAQALCDAGVDLLILATMLDIQETRIALLAAKSVAKIPVIASMTFDENGRTLTGSDPLTCLNILQSLGADAFGVNCSSGPDRMLEVIRQVNAYAAIPLMAKPNAGLPVVENGHTVFPMDADTFNQFTAAFRDAGVSMLGGCCGTTPDHIRKVAETLKGQKPRPVPRQEGLLLLSSPRKTVAASPTNQEPLRVVGERINPTGKPGLQAELREGRLDTVKRFASEQKAAGADVLDVNVGMPGIDEKAVMLKAVEELAVASDLPLCIDSSRPDVIEAAVRAYPGRVLVNSLSAEAHKLEKLLPVLRQYGPAFIALPVDDEGVPEMPAERIAVLEKILNACRQQGVPAENAVVDGLVLTVSANPEHARSTLKTIRYVSGELKLNTVMGLSNVSFGLPGREHINSAFFAMAASQGLSMVIANPSAPLLMEAKRAADLLNGRDPSGRKYIAAAAGAPPTAKGPAAPGRAQTGDPIREAVLGGEKEAIVEVLEAALGQGREAFDLVRQHLIPAIQTVGEKYDRREYFLPQLIAAAETMERGVQFLTPKLSRENRGRKAVGVIATVKGDVHDIGKKIVSLLLRNNGYEIMDLGKSVDEDTIVAKALEAKADFIGLSALMTTTMSEMETVIQKARRQGYAGKIILGGAVVTQKFAEEVGADGFAPDANKAVELLARLLPRQTETR